MFKTDDCLIYRTAGECKVIDISKNIINKVVNYIENHI